MVVRNKAPITAVQAVVAVVTHHEIVTWRNRAAHRTVVVAAVFTVGEIRDGHVTLALLPIEQDLMAHIAELFRIPAHVGRTIGLVIIARALGFHTLPVDEQGFVTIFDRVARHTHHSLDVIDGRVHRVAEDYDIAAGRVTHFHDLAVDDWKAYAVFVLVHQDEIAILQCGQHGAGWNPEWLEQKRAQQEYDHDHREKASAVFHPPWRAVGLVI